MKRVLVIPGSIVQAPLIKRLKQDNYEVVCINPNFEAEGVKLADYSIEGDILDEEKCLRVAKEYGVGAVMSDECDIAMPVIAYLGECLNLNTLSQRDAELYTDKFQMRIFCKENGFAYPEFSICYDMGQAINFYKKSGFKKMIIKPLDSNSSRGVFSINEEQELIDNFDKAISFSKKRKAVICERYIEGVEFTVDGIMTGSKHYSLAISEKKHYEYNENIACELFFSYSNPDFDYERLREINDSYVEKTNLKFGFTHAEYKYEKGKYYLIEIGARGGGNFISSHIVPLLTGLDNYEFLIRKSFGLKYDIDLTMEASNKNRCAVLKFFDIDTEGHVEGVDNLELLTDNDKIIMHEFRFKEGDYISQAENDSKRIGFYIAYEEDRDKLKALMDEISKRVKIRVR